MHFYGLNDREVLKMPISRFWLLSRSVDRISAEEAIQATMVAINSQSSEGFTDMMSGLQKQLGVIVDMDHAAVKQTEQLDRDGLNILRNLGKVN